MDERSVSVDPARGFTTFGSLLRYLRRRARLTQRDLSIAVGYSTPQISLLENDHRLPDLAAIAALFVPALDVQDEPELVQRLLQFAAVARETDPPTPSTLPIRRASGAAEAVATVGAGAWKEAIRLSSHLPAPALPLLGRAHELDAARFRLRDPGVRLLTLIGPPGVGKTRLALQLAWEAEAIFADGAHWVALSAVHDPALVPMVIMQALGISDMTGVEPEAAIRLLNDYLRPKQLLLVLDNFEHLMAASALAGELLAAAPRLKIMVTSRAPLHVYGEYELPVPPLALPDLAFLPPHEELAHLPSVALFVARAQAVNPTFTLTATNALAIAAVCVRLDGLPLALELAAAQSKLFTPRDLASQLIRRVPGYHQEATSLKLLTRGARDLPDRHRTLHGAIAWSYQLLEPAEQLLFECLGVLVGGFDLAAAEAVFGDGGERENGGHGDTGAGRWGDGENGGAGDVGRSLRGRRSAAPVVGRRSSAAFVIDILAALMDKSLVQRDERHGEPRFMMLETIRAFALERLAARGRTALVHRRHANFFLSLAQHADGHLQTADQAMWLRRLEEDLPNFRGALRWAIEASGDDAEPFDVEPRRNELALQLCVALWRFWRYRCLLGEGYRWVLQALHADLTSVRPAPPEVRAGAAWSAGILAAVMGQEAEATAHLKESLRLWRFAEDEEGVAGALTALGARAMKRGEVEQAIALQQEALALYQGRGQLRGMAYAHNALGESLRFAGDYGASRAHYQASLEISRQVGHPRGVAVAVGNIALVALTEGDYAAAQRGFAEDMPLFLEIGDPINVATSIMGLASVAVTFDTPDYLHIAALLFGYAQDSLHKLGGHLEVADQNILDRHLAACRAALGDAAFDAAWSEGTALTLEQALAYAHLCAEAPPGNSPSSSII